MLAFLTAFASRVSAQDTRAHFHHVHLNVTNPQKTIEFYERVFGATKIKFEGKNDALYTERSFILLNQVASPPPSELKSGLWHMGWGGVDVPHEYEWWKAHGVKIHTPLYQLGQGYVTYFSGPDDELIEVNTMGHHRFGHIHLLAADVNATAQWYADNLGLELRRRDVPKPKDMGAVRAWSNAFTCDNVQLIVYGRPDYEPKPGWWRFDPLTEFEPSKGRAIDHIAFSYRKIEPVFQRMKAAGVQIEEPIADREKEGFKSFFIWAPDKVLVEIVEAKPVPEGIWDDRESDR